MQNIFLTSLLAGIALLQPVLRAQSPKIFPTPDAAAQALVDACEKQDTAALAALFGPKYDEIINSGDPEQDNVRRARFVARAKESLKVEPDQFETNRFIISVGNDQWPLPMPILKIQGGYRFDAEQAKQEILARRVGANELDAIAALNDMVEAELEYAYFDRNKNGMRDYAQKILSDPGKKNGLYWEVKEGEQPSPLAAIVDQAITEGYSRPAMGEPVHYHGYNFRILTGQGPNAPNGARDYIVQGHMIGGFAIVAFPAEYAVSGVKTFIVNHDGIVLEKDLGPNTKSLATAMRRYNPDKTWTEAPKVGLDEK